MVMTVIDRYSCAVLFYLCVISPLMGSDAAAQNLILNPGCEDSLVNGDIPHWEEVVGTNWTQRKENPLPYEGGSYFFAGAAALAELRQDVDVSAYADSIDNSTQRFVFSGYVHSWEQSPPDSSRVVLEFLDISKTVKLDSLDSGNYANPDEWVYITLQSIAPPNARYIRIRLISLRENGTNNDGYFDALVLSASDIVFAESGNEKRPDELTLLQNYPNPFNPMTTITYILPHPGNMSVLVYNSAGQIVRTLVNSYQVAGRYQVDFNAEGLASGTYFAEVQMENYRKTIRMVYVK